MFRLLFSGAERDLFFSYINLHYKLHDHDMGCGNSTVKESSFTQGATIVSKDNHEGTKTKLGVENHQESAVTKETEEKKTEQNGAVLMKNEENAVTQDNPVNNIHDAESLEQTKKDLEERISKIIDQVKDIEETDGEKKMTNKDEIHVEEPDISMEDVCMPVYVKNELLEQIMLPVERPDTFSLTYNLLHGPPGCGKTMLAKAVASQAECKFIYHRVVPGKYAPYTDELRKAFDKARSSAPCILFLELNDMEKRDHGPGTDYLINQLLCELDGLDSKEKNVNLFVIGSVTSERGLDPSLLRPGRLSHLLLVPLPDEKTRVEILKVTLRDTAEVQEEDFEYIASQTDGYTGADLAEVCKKAASLAGGKKSFKYETFLPKISRGHLMEACKTTHKTLSDEKVQYYQQLSNNNSHHLFGLPHKQELMEKFTFENYLDNDDDDDDDDLYS